MGEKKDEKAVCFLSIKSEVRTRVEVRTDWTFALPSDVSWYNLSEGLYRLEGNTLTASLESGKSQHSYRC